MTRKQTKEQRDVLLRYILDHEAPEGPLYDCLMDLDVADRELEEECRLTGKWMENYGDLRVECDELRAKLAFAEGQRDYQERRRKLLKEVHEGVLAKLAEADKTIEQACEQLDQKDEQLGEMRKKLAEAEARIDEYGALVEWVEANLPEMECRQDEDCDHCLGLQIVADIRNDPSHEPRREAARREYVDAVNELRALREVKRISEHFTQEQYCTGYPGCPQHALVEALAAVDALRKGEA